MNRTQNLDQLISLVIDELRKHGNGERCLWTCTYKHLSTIRTWFLKAGTLEYDDAVLSDYVAELNRRHASGGLSTKPYNAKLLAADRLREVAQTGRLECNVRLRGSRFKLNDHYESLLAEFEKTLTCSKSTRGDISWAIRRYLSYMEACGRMVPEEIHPQDIHAFLVHCASSLSSGSIGNIRSYVRKFHAFMASEGICTLNADEVLNTVVRIRTGLRPGMEKEEFQLILKQINPLTVKGKRDRAILLLAAYTGLRGADIVNLKLKDIDWTRREIHIEQSKTGVPLALPLLPEAAAAVMEYILNGRPAVDSEYVFLRAVTPIRQMGDSMVLDHLLRKYQTLAGITRFPWDGKGFHSIRRMLGREMVVAGTPITTVSQVLGQVQTESTKPYIALDNSRLRICALDFSGIPMKKGES